MLACPPRRPGPSLHPKDRQARCEAVAVGMGPDFFAVLSVWRAASVAAAAWLKVCVCPLLPVSPSHNLCIPLIFFNVIRWFEEAGDGADGWDIEKITNRIGESDCHVVNEDNVMELNLVDIAGKTTRRKDTPPKGGDDRDSSPESPSSEGQK